MRHNAEKHQAEYPLTAETVLESTYMDDTVGSTETEDNTIYLYIGKNMKIMWYENS